MAELERLQVTRLTDDLQAVKDLIAPKASTNELRVFAAVAVHLELDPFAGQICLIGRWDKELGRMVYRHQVTVAGRRAIAFRTGRLRGIDGPVWCGPRNEAGELEWLEVWDNDKDFPYAARCLVSVDGWDHPANGTVKWTEFAQAKKDGELMPTWQAMPSHMIGKVAESLALRRAFPEVAEAVSYGNAWPGDAPVDADDAALIAEANPDTGEIPRPAPASAAGAVVPGPRRPVERRRRRDEVPLEVYDNLPEAQG
jgi:hypothetical protein